MRMHAFGPGGVQVATIGQGTWNVPERGAARDEAKRALRAGIALGMTHIDTAEMYGSGEAERIVGEAIADLPREELFVVSKVLPTNASERGTIRACESSLERLGLDYLDCYLLHWPGSYPIAETLKAFARLRSDGKIRSFGLSNFAVDEWNDARAALPVGESLACNQVLYHLEERTVEVHEEPTLLDDGAALVAYTPFGRGAAEKKRAGFAVLAGIAREMNVSTNAVMLAFLTRERNAFAIPKAATIAHVEENAKAGDLVLDAAAIAQIDAAYPVRMRRGGLPTL